MTQKFIIGLETGIEIQYETHSFRDRLLDFVFYFGIRETNLKTNFSNFS